MHIRPGLTLLVFFLLIGPSALFNRATAADRPDWIDNPGIGVVGSASLHVRGRHAQEELAISRARIRLAARLGVEVDSIQRISEKHANDESSVSSDRPTTQKISNKTVKAYTRALGHDPQRDIGYAWLIPSE
ncbi:hypothetical protein N8198_00690 [Gammaproteobacteria bacterium]|nr:hypothetical protein [Gammaproteobacteria bacterium]